MQRPRGVTILAVLALIVAASNLLAGALLVTGTYTIEQVFGPVPKFGDMQADFEHILKFTILALSLAILGIGVGLLALKNWARMAMRVITVFGILGAVISMVMAFGDGEAERFLVTAISGGLYYWAYYYLGRPAIRAVFGPHPHPPPGSVSSPPAPPPSSDSAG